MKSSKKICLLVCGLTLLSGGITNAGFRYLWKVSSGTYVSTYHPDNYFADEYNGTASVRGTDRGYNPYRGNKVCYKWTKIKYNVQGDKSEAIAKSRGRNSSQVVTEKITVFDKWNNGPKTTAHYEYDTEDVDTNTPGPIMSKVEEKER